MNIQTCRVAMTCTAGLLPCVLAYPLSSCVHRCNMSQERSINTLPNELLRLILEYLHPRGMYCIRNVLGSASAVLQPYRSCMQLHDAHSLDLPRSVLNPLATPHRVACVRGTYVCWYACRPGAMCKSVQEMELSCRG